MNDKRNVIIVTDGDKRAKHAVELAAKNIGGRCISRSAGNPTELSGDEIVNYVLKAMYDPVVIMVDDLGHPGYGKGELAISQIMTHPEINVLGVVAVASNTEMVSGVKVDFSVTCDGKIINKAVDKEGHQTEDNKIYGDTVDVLNSYNFPVIVGIGDIGKMNRKDDCIIGAPIITKALEEIIKYKH
ncbi:stage V sporulation protein AE [Abyssisolibacter fermentans]|uniref:stage V sporulation protein AE n=1 Tax=Abyssisolibacter fermentans TaxID=1766203 RepID=UPI00082D8593|nr:stage V sporulation protein AE [Abyssisolibacter fermentans]